MDYIRRIVVLVDKINEWVGRSICVLVFPIMFSLTYEVIMRYVFNRPTIWAHELSGMFYAIYFLLGGAYALRWDAHIRIDLLYGRLSNRRKAIVNSFTWMLFYLFCAVILLKGIPFALDSMLNLERSNSLLGLPVWLTKIFIPLSILLLLLQGLGKSIEWGILAITGVEISLSDRSGAALPEGGES